MQGISDVSDGSFQLVPKPQRVRMFRVIGQASAAVSVATCLVLAVLAVVMHEPQWLLGAVLFAVVAATARWVFWRAIRPPLVAADARTITYSSAFRSVTVPRAELTMIFKGQVVQRARYTAWVQSYVFAIGAGKVMFVVPAVWFDAVAIDAFGARLGVPVRGDFTQSARDAINRSARPSTRY
jgi:hypothetical protein